MQTEAVGGRWAENREDEWDMKELGVIFVLVLFLDVSLQFLKRIHIRKCRRLIHGRVTSLQTPRFQHM